MAKIHYVSDLQADRRAALLGVGQRRGLWTYWGRHEDRHVLEFADAEGNPSGTERYLTDAEVDRLFFEYLVDEDNWPKNGASHQ